MKRLFIIGLLICSPIVTLAQSKNIGIIDGLWFSQDTFFAGDSMRIYTAIQNNSGHDIEGSVEFFDNDISIGKKNFTALDRRIAELWIDTIAAEGKHDFSVVITEAGINKPGEAVNTIQPRIVRSAETVSVDIDTDGDDIGNKEDNDDDGDGYSDIEEKKLGTDPLDKTIFPQPAPTNDNSPQNENVLQELIDLVRGDSGDGKKDTEETTMDNVVDNESSVAVPIFVQKISDQYPAVKTVTEPLNDLQNRVIPRVQKQQVVVEKKISQSSRLKPQLDTKKSLKPSDTQAITTKSHTSLDSGWRHWLWVGYAWLLSAVHWIFSCLVCMIILIFIVLHLVLKLLFYLFRKK